MMKHLPAQRRRRNRKIDINPIRRAEIVRDARDVGAMDTEDRGRWLVAWALHNPGAKDQVWGVMRAAEKMGGEITRAEAIAIMDEANAIPRAWSADRLARYLGVTYERRQALHHTTIGSVNVGKRARKELRKRRWRRNAERRRRASGVRARADYEANSTAAKARAEGVTRMTIYRRKRAAEQAKNKADVTGPSTACFNTPVDGPVTPEGKQGCPSGAIAPKEGRGYPSSQTAATPAVDKYASLPLELRLMALGLPVGRVPAFAFGRRAA
jgi:hypothetical protein